MSVANAPKELVPATHDYIDRLVVASNAPTLPFLSTLVYFQRAGARPMTAPVKKPHPYRIFLEAFVLSRKFIDDCPPRLRDWQRWSAWATGVRHRLAVLKADERCLLHWLQWDLTLREQDLLRELHPYLEPLRFSIAQWVERQRRRQLRLPKTASTRPAARAHLTSRTHVKPPVSIGQGQAPGGDGPGRSMEQSTCLEGGGHTLSHKSKVSSSANVHHLGADHGG